MLEVDPKDATGMAIKDASDLAYSGELVSPTSSRRRLQSGSTACSVVYDSTAAQHKGSCDMPMSGEENVAGAFTLNVVDAAGESVGGGGSSFEVSSCPEVHRICTITHSNLRLCTHE